MSFLKKMQASHCEDYVTTNSNFLIKWHFQKLFINTDLTTTPWCDKIFVTVHGKKSYRTAHRALVSLTEDTHECTFMGMPEMMVIKNHRTWGRGDIRSFYFFLVIFLLRWKMLNTHVLAFQTQECYQIYHLIKWFYSNGMHF
jgi:hypothetical protein